MSTIVDVRNSGMLQGKMQGKNVLIIGSEGEAASALIEALKSAGAEVFGTVIEYDKEDPSEDVVRLQDMGVKIFSGLLIKDSEDFRSQAHDTAADLWKFGVSIDYVIYTPAAGVQSFTEGLRRMEDKELRKKYMKYLKAMRDGKDNAAAEMPDALREEIIFGFGAGALPIIIEELNGNLSKNCKTVAITYADRIVPYPVYPAKDALQLVSKEHGFQVVSFSEFLSNSSKIFPPIAWKVLWDTVYVLKDENPTIMNEHEVEVMKIFHRYERTIYELEIDQFFSEKRVYKTNEESIEFLQKFEELKDCAEMSELLAACSKQIIRNLACAATMWIADDRLIPGQIPFFRGKDVLRGEIEPYKTLPVEETTEKRYTDQ